jgi:DNA-binding winged helix-turn-helix (wHTH) protein
MALAMGNDLNKERESSIADGYLYRFGQFTLDSRKRAVSRADSPVPLTPKAFDVLLFLVQNPNRLVAKEELL